MNFRWYAGFFIIGLLVMLGIASLESSPGYMDADYYYASGLRIATEKTFSEPFLWNYLADPGELPQPAFTYWMPFAGILSALGIALTGKEGFWAARFIFIPLAACIPPLTAYLATTFTPKRWAGLLAGALALFSCFYLVYLPNTETFGIYMFFGGVMFLLILRLQQEARKETSIGGNNIPGGTQRTGTVSPMWVYLAGGGITGLMYMTRADGLIWLLMFVSAIGMQWVFNNSNRPEGEQKKPTNFFWIALLLCILGFVIISSPWVIRNWQIFGTIFAPGSGRALWLTSYDELFAFPSDQLTFTRWVNGGLGSILRARAWALGLNAASTFAVQGGIFLMPLVLAGIWIWRKDWRVIVGGLGWLAIFLTMTFVFPFQGARGGFFHAGAGFQTLIWALVPVGLYEFVDWGRRRRNWNPGSAVVKFSVGIIGLTILVTGFVTWQRLTGVSGPVSAWGATERAYEEVEAYLKESDVPPDYIVMVNNPPGYFAMTGRQAIVIPDGDFGATMRAAEKYMARYLVLDQNYPQGLEEIYREPDNYPGLRYLETIAEMHIYLLEP